MAVTRGPIPKRDAERRRRNAAEVGTTTVEMTGEVIVPDADPNWHRLAREWYESLRKSGQHKYMEPSDWAAARILAFSMTKQLASSRPSSQWFAAIWSAMNDLLTTEGARRRVRMEVERRAPKADQGELATVTPIDRYSSL